MIGKNQTEKIIREALDIEIKALNDFKNEIDIESVTEAVSMIERCRENNGKIITIGAGNSSIIARKVAHNFYCIGMPAFFLTSEEGLHGGLGVLKKEDLVIAFSKGGKTYEMLNTIPVIKQKNAEMISVTENQDTDFAKAADLVLVVKTEREVDSHNMIATASSACMIAMFDAIIALFIEMDGFDEEKFGIIHPGGAVGEILKNKYKK